MARASGKQSAPPRPQPPKLSLKRIEGQQNATSSISIRFSASSQEDEDDDGDSHYGLDNGITMETSNNDAVPLDVQRSSARNVMGNDGEVVMADEGIAPPAAAPRVPSKSAPASEVTTPVSQPPGATSAVMTRPSPGHQTAGGPRGGAVSRTSENSRVESEGEKSFIAGIRERLQDPLSAFIEKIEEFSETPKADSTLRKLCKADSLDSSKGNGVTMLPIREHIATSRELAAFPSPTGAAAVSAYRDKKAEAQGEKNLQNGVCDRSNGEESAAVMQSQSDRTRHASYDSEQSAIDGELTLLEDHAPLAKLQGKRSGSFNIVDDFYSEPAEDFSGCPTPGSVVKSSSWDVLSLPPAVPTVSDTPSKSKSPLQKLIPNKFKGTLGGTSPAVNSGGQHGQHGQPSKISMTLSGLLSTNTPEDNCKDQTEEFFDPAEEPLISHNSSAKPPPGPHHETVDVSPSQASKPDLPTKSTPSMTSRHKLLSVTVAVLAYAIIPLPPFLSGVVLGGALVTAVMVLYWWWVAPPTPREPFVLEDLASLPPLEVPEMKDSKNEEGKFKGWMNELKMYSTVEYHINKTHSVLVHLEATKLRLQTPKHNIPKRAMWDEPPPHTAMFVEQRHYDLLGCKVLLQPAGLVKKRLWSKKYPICLVIPRARALPSSFTNLTSDSPPDIDHKGASINSSSGSNNDGDKTDEAFVLVYLFGRTCREKEEWYRRFVAATQGKPLPTRIADLLFQATATESPASPARGNSPSPTVSPSLPSHRRASSLSSSPSLENLKHHSRKSSADSNFSDPGKDFVAVEVSQEQHLLEYLRYMAKVMPAETIKRMKPASGSERKESSRPSACLPPPLLCEPQVAWINALMARCFWDLLREHYWADKIRQKIQKKLSKIHVPYFIDELTVTAIELGTEVPLIRRAARPFINDLGLWVDLDIAYNGGFRMTLETKCNLMKLKKTHKVPSTKSHRKNGGVRSPVTDEEEEDSAESSTDEEREENMPAPRTAEEKSQEKANNSGETRGKKILRIMDKITQSKYFQQAAENRYIKRAMEQVSNTQLVLNVEVQSLVGTLTVHIPSPPTDRVWYGFRTNPRLWLSAKPRVGEREVSVTHVTDWIEKKLATEFQRVFVMPNMDDIPIPLMCDHLDKDVIGVDSSL